MTSCENVRVGVWLVTGVQAAGKSTVADLMARQFDRGVHVRGGQFYRWAVRGWVHPGDEREAIPSLLARRFGLPGFGLGPDGRVVALS